MSTEITFEVERFARVPATPGVELLLLAGSWSRESAAAQAPVLVIDDGEARRLEPLSGPSWLVSGASWHAAYWAPTWMVERARAFALAGAGDAVAELPRPQAHRGDGVADRAGGELADARAALGSERRRVTELERRGEKLEATRRAAQSHLAAATEARQSAETRAAAAERAREAADARLVVLSAELARALADAAAAEQAAGEQHEMAEQVGVQTARAAEAIAERDRAVAALERAQEDRREAERAAFETRDGLEARAAEMEQRLAGSASAAARATHLERSLATSEESREQAAALEAALAEASARAGRTGELEQQLLDAASRVERLRRELHEARRHRADELGELEQELIRASASVAHLPEVERQLAGAEDQIAELEAELAVARERMADAGAAGFE